MASVFVLMFTGTPTLATASLSSSAVSKMLLIAGIVPNAYEVDYKHILDQKVCLRLTKAKGRRGNALEPSTSPAKDEHHQRKSNNSRSRRQICTVVIRGRVGEFLTALLGGAGFPEIRGLLGKRGETSTRECEPEVRRRRLRPDRGRVREKL